jgi:hypothetical protein
MDFYEFDHGTDRRNGSNGLGLDPSVIFKTVLARDSNPLTVKRDLNSIQQHEANNIVFLN